MDGGGGVLLGLVLGCHAPHEGAEWKVCFNSFIDVYLWDSLVRAGAVTPDLLLPLPLAILGLVPGVTKTWPVKCSNLHI